MQIVSFLLLDFSILGFFVATVTFEGTESAYMVPLHARPFKDGLNLLRHKLKADLINNTEMSKSLC